MTATKNVLFMEQRAGVFGALEAQFRSHEDVETVFVRGASEALRAIDGRDFAVLVADAGPSLLEDEFLLSRVREERPGIVRLVVVPQDSDPAGMAKIAPLAHQFIREPVTNERLAYLVDRVHSVLQLVQSEAVKSVAGSVRQLPPAPRLHSELSRILQDPSTSAMDVASVVEQDVAMTAKVLQLVNSAFFCAPKDIARIDEAVQFLGGQTIKNIALGVEVFDAAGQLTPTQRGWLDQIQQHSFQVAMVAAHIAEDRRSADDAYCAGILHDIGLVLIAAEFPQLLAPMMHVSSDADEMAYSEQAVFGAHHAHLGAYLVGIWGLSFDIIEAVAGHHSSFDADSLDVRTSVRVAHLLLDECERMPLESADGDVNEWVEKLGAEERLPEWRDYVSKGLGLTTGAA